MSMSISMSMSMSMSMVMSMGDYSPFIVSAPIGKPASTSVPTIDAITTPPLSENATMADDVLLSDAPSSSPSYAQTVAVGSPVAAAMVTIASAGIVIITALAAIRRPRKVDESEASPSITTV
jgi:hypothetical protein